MNVARNVLLEERLVAGGGAVEMAISCFLKEKAKSKLNIHHIPYLAVADAMEVIPRTLIQNCGGSVLRSITELRSKHLLDPVKNISHGIDGHTGAIADMENLEIMDPLQVKSQVFKTAVEVTDFKML